MRYLGGARMLATGQVLASGARKFRVERVLGQGAMGLLVAATDLPRGGIVALKLMRPAALRVPELLARFHREIATASRLAGDHVAHVRGSGVLDSGEPFLAMELLDGEDLGAILARQGRFAVAEAASVMLQACRALQEAHAIGIVHRDVSPANVFVARTARGAVVKVLDFGVATANPMDAPISPMTRTGTVLGCPLYASPEQLQSSKHVDARSDLWSIGAILYELLTGHVPFVADSMGGLLGAIHLTEPAPIGDARSDVPPQLARVVMRCLSKNRDDRFASADALADALAPFCPRTFPPASAVPSPPRARDARSGSATVIVVVVALVLVIGFTAGAWAIKHRAGRGRAGPPPYQRTSAQPQ